MSAERQFSLTWIFCSLFLSIRRQIRSTAWLCPVESPTSKVSGSEPEKTEPVPVPFRIPRPPPRPSERPVTAFPPGDSSSLHSFTKEGRPAHWARRWLHPDVLARFLLIKLKHLLDLIFLVRPSATDNQPTVVVGNKHDRLVVVHLITLSKLKSKCLRFAAKKRRVYFRNHLHP